MLQNITRAINELKVSSKTKKAISDSEDSEEEKVKRKKKSKTSTKKTEKQKPAKHVSEERQTHLENFLCGQIEKLNVELNREREWRDQVSSI